MQIKVIPIDRGRVRKPDGQILNPNGEIVEDNTFWRRRRADGDVSIETVQSIPKKVKG